MIRAALCLAAMLFCMTDIKASASELPPALAAFKTQRAEITGELAKTIAICVARHDTEHPSFHGCIDWHSSVHGTWALTAYALMTGDTQYDALIDAALAPDLLAQERQYLAEHPDFEMPYGRAWFLRLAIDAAKRGRNEALNAMADDVAASLVAHYSSVEPDPASIAYESATWALINLYDFGRARGDAKLTGFVSELVRQHYLVNGACPYAAREVETGEFMALCSNWALLVSRVLPHDAFVKWVAVFMPPEDLPKAIAKPASVHQAGLNFSRSWGLWAIYWQTRDARYLDAFLDHLHMTYDKSDRWKGGYETVGHWVPQFGMMGLMESYRDAP